MKSLRDIWMLPTIALAVLGAGYGCVWALGLFSERPDPAATPLTIQPLPLVRSPQSPRFAPSDRNALSRQIQKELARVSCYQGSLSGVWTPATRDAMRTFLVAVNAQLPTDQPDEALLSLLQAQQEATCAAPPCAEGNCRGRTTEAVVIAAPAQPYRIAGQAPPSAADALEPPARPAIAAPAPAPRPSEAPAPSIREVAPTTPPVSAPPDASKPAEASPTMPAPATVAVATSERDKPEPRETRQAAATVLADVELLENSAKRQNSEAKTEELPRYTAVAPSSEPSAKPKKRAYRHRRASGPKQPKFVKSFIRSVNKTLSSLGF